MSGQVGLLPVRMVSLDNLIVESATHALEDQSQDGSMIPGFNGPYHDPETPVRNTAHWMISFLKAYKITGEDRFRFGAERAAYYLQSEIARPQGFTFHHRDTNRKDACNGLIGQAWTIEALAQASTDLELPDLRELAEEVFLLHDFDNALGLWKIREINGKTLGFDVTFNHQLWFAAAGSMLATNSLIDDQLSVFLDRLPMNLGLYKNGLVQHPNLPKLNSGMSFGLRTKRLVATAVQGNWSRQRDRVSMTEKAVGYHAFNLYAFAILSQRYPDYDAWSSDLMKSMVSYAKSSDYLETLEGNRYGYSYNSPGFEIAYAIICIPYLFGEDPEGQASEWVGRQLVRCYDFETSQRRLITEDPVNHAARIYEATRLPNLDVPIVSTGGSL